MRSMDWRASSETPSCTERIGVSSKPWPSTLMPRSAARASPAWVSSPGDGCRGPHRTFQPSAMRRGARSLLPHASSSTLLRWRTAGTVPAGVRRHPSPVPARCERTSRPSARHMAGGVWRCRTRGFDQPDVIVAQNCQKKFSVTSKLGNALVVEAFGGFAHYEGHLGHGCAVQRLGHVGRVPACGCRERPHGGSHPHGRWPVRTWWR